MDHRWARAWAVSACALSLAWPSWGAAEDAAEDEASAEVAAAGLCDTKLELRATLYEHAHPERSFAMLSTPDDTQAGLYRRGMYVGGLRIIAIEPRGVLLEHGPQSYCWLRLVPGEREPAKPPKKKKRKKKKRKRASLPMTSVWEGLAARSADAPADRTRVMVWKQVGGARELEALLVLDELPARSTDLERVAAHSQQLHLQGHLA